MYIGMDLHKNHIQVAAIDKKGQILYNSKIDNNRESLERFFDRTSRDSKVVMESSSVWYDTYHSMESMGFDTILSNPIKTKAIASAKIKTDKIDAKVLAELLRANLIPACYMPPKEIMQLRELVRHREFLVRQRTDLKNKVHGILLLNGIRIPGKPFTPQYKRALQNLGNYRIDDYLGVIETLDHTIKAITKKIESHVKDDKAASLLVTIPGIGYYSALLIASEIGDISRFEDSHHLCAYAGVCHQLAAQGEQHTMEG